MEAKLSTDTFESLYTNQIDANLGIFAARTQNCIGKYLFAYLNTLIHSLLKLHVQVRQKYL